MFVYIHQHKKSTQRFASSDPNDLIKSVKMTIGHTITLDDISEEIPDLWEKPIRYPDDQIA